MISMIIKNIVFILLLAWLAYGDYKFYKIPNRNVLLGLLTGIILMVFSKGFEGFCMSIIGGIIFLILGYILWKLKVFRAGDAKFICLIGIFEGYKDMWMTMSVAILASGVVALFMMIRDKSLKDRVKRIAEYLRFIFFSKKFVGYWAIENDHLKMPYASTCFLGIFIYKLYLVISYLYF
jgi:membrane protein